MGYSKNFNSDIKWNNKRFQQIIDFYLEKCPVSGTSFRTKTFEEYGITYNGFKSLKKQMLAVESSSLKHNYYSCKRKSQLEESFRLVESIEPPLEYCVFLNTDERRVMDSLFAAIRNALAHGSFTVKSYKRQRVYYFMNFKEYKKAELAIREDTLLAWIDIISNFDNRG